MIFLPGLLANNDMPQRSNPALSKPHPEEVFQDCHTKWKRERSAFHPGQECFTPTKAVYVCADQPVTLPFRLQQDGGPYIPASDNAELEAFVRPERFYETYPVTA
jgi:hypothetical protein